MMMHVWVRRPTVWLLALLIPVSLVAGCESDEEVQARIKRAVEKGEPDVPFVESPQPVVNKMLELGQVTDRDTLYDLGSGDGRIPITAAIDYGAYGVGVEIEPELVEQARAHAEEAGVASRVEFQQGDLFDADLSDATVVTIYLLPEINMKLRPKLFRELEPGTRVVSHDFDMGHWRPDTTWISGDHTVYRWTIPEEPPPFVDVEENRR